MFFVPFFHCRGEDVCTWEIARAGGFLLGDPVVVLFGKELLECQKILGERCVAMVPVLAVVRKHSCLVNQVV